MKLTLINQFTKSKQALTNQRKKLQSEIDRIDAVLDSVTTGNGHIRSEHNAGLRTKVSNKLTLREAITRVTKSKPMTKAEIVEAVQKIGYRFTTSDPINSTNALLYSAVGKAQFRNQNGKFSVK